MPKGFRYDLQRGKRAEYLVAGLLTRAGFGASVVDGENKAYDVFAHGGKLTTEVKFDEYERKSGNIAIEVYNPRRGCPSGLTATRAFLWAHVLADYLVWVTPVEFLRRYIDENPPQRIIDRGGDNNATLYLYASIDILPAIFMRIDNMASDDLGLLLTEYISHEY